MKASSQFKDIFRYYTDLDGQGGTSRSKMTLEKLSAALGYKSPSSLSMLATGQRLPSKQLLEKLMTLWKLPSQQKKVLSLQLEIQRKNQKGKDTLRLLQDLRRIDPNSKYTVLNVDVFDSIKDWHYLALQNFVGAPNFTEDARELSRLFRRKISPAKITKALQKLEKVGNIKRNPKTNRLEKAYANTDTTHDIPSAAIRHHHKGMINLALEAIDEQTVDNRLFNSLTLRIDKKHLPEIKKRIMNLIMDLNETYADEKSDHVYQMNAQFFELTQTLEAPSTESKALKKKDLV